VQISGNDFKMNILILGAGRMGRAIAFDCLDQRDVSQVTVADISEDQVTESMSGLLSPFTQNASLGIN